VADSVDGNTGTWQGTGTKWTAGKLGASAGSFNGTDGYVTAATAANLNITGDLTLQAWANPNLLNNSYRTIANKANNTDALNRQYGIGISGADNSFRGVLYTGSTEYSIGTTLVPSLNTWYLVTLIKSGTTGTMYVNATGYTPVTVGAVSNTTVGAFSIGSPFGATELFPGSIDEIALWNPALSASEITQLYNGGAGFQYPFTTPANLDNFMAFFQ
jgi:hypothetical protein